MSPGPDSHASSGSRPAPPSPPSRSLLVMPGAQAIGTAEITAVSEVLRTKVLDRHRGSQVAAFEQECAHHLGVPHVLALNSGTSALHAALVAAGLGPGDEVLVPAYSFIGVAAAVQAVRATAVLVEVDRSLTIDPDAAQAARTGRTGALIAVHMRGAPCDLDALKPLCERYGLVLVEDVAQAFGGSYHGAALGSIGQVGCFSLQAFKLITTGEGGLLATRDAALFERACFFHDAATYWQRQQHGSQPIPEPAGEGGHACLNLRMSELAGALGRVQLRRAASLIAALRARKQALADQLGTLPGVRRRLLHDPAGEVGLALILELDPPLPAAQIAAELAAMGEPVGPLLAAPDEETPDRHYGGAWGRMLDPGLLRTSALSGQTAALLRRCLQVQVDPAADHASLARTAERLRDAITRHQ